MASYHLQVKTIKRSAGRSATAAAAYRSAEAILCAREGRMHDYTRKSGVAESFIVLPNGALDWAGDRAALWNAAEERETRVNSVTAREWELALPAELSAAERRALAHDFAQQLVARYGVAADVAIHAPHREGDARNHHAHVLTTTRRLEAEGLTEKTRVLDAAKSGGPEIEAMRATWAELQNAALERAGEAARVDHRSLEAQRENALARGDARAAEALDRAPEVKLGPAASAIERRAMRAAERDGRAYEPVTDRGRAVHEARMFRALYVGMRIRVERARDAYSEGREQGRDRIGAGLAALRAAAGRHAGVEEGRGAERSGPTREELQERLARLTGRGGEREQEQEALEKPASPAGKNIRERIDKALGRGRPVEREDREADQNDIREQGRGRSRDDGVGL